MQIYYTLFYILCLFFYYCIYKCIIFIFWLELAIYEVCNTQVLLLLTSCAVEICSTNQNQIIIIAL